MPEILFPYGPSVFTLCLTVISLVSYLAYTQWRENASIQALGGRAPEVKTWAPFGLDFLMDNIKRSSQHQGLAVWEELFTAYGHRDSPLTIEVTVLRHRIVLTSDWENIRAVLATQFNDFGKGERFHAMWEEFLGDSIFNSDGDAWKTSRSLIRPQFVRERVGDLEVVDRHARALVGMMGNGGEAVDVVDLFFRFTLDTATEFLLGHCVDSLKHGETSFGNAFSEVQRIQMALFRRGIFSKLYPKAEFRKHLRTLNAFVNKFVQEALAIPESELDKNDFDKDTNKPYTFLHALASSSRSPTWLRDQIVAVLLAGRDTTASTLSWLFFELAQRPDVVQKLRAEVLSTVGPDAAATYEQLKSMKYMSWTLNETLRLYPSVPMNTRTACYDTTLPRGGGKDGTEPLGIPKGTEVAYSAYNLQLNAEHYPSPDSADYIDPILFEPERWRTWTPKPFTYLPFNGGPRICVGQQFALMEMSAALVRILQRFETIKLGPKMAELIEKAERERDVEGEKRLYYKDGTESHAWRFAMRRDRVLKMTHEPILTPGGKVDVVFL